MILYFWFIIAAIVPLLLFDLLISIEYRKFNEHWIADGKPSGFFSYPPGLVRGAIAPFKSGRARNRFTWQSLFSNPVWLRESTEATLLLWLIRVFVFGNAAVVLFILAGIFWV